jgi:pilus assembly protein CpaE
MNRTIMALLGRRRLGEDGVSAVEFALVAPVLFFSLLAMVDLGLAIYERMTIDHVLRAGAQAAMEDPGPVRVLEVLTATAATNFPLAGETEPDGTNAPIFTVGYPVCACADGVPVACSTTCPGPTATSVYYRLSSAKNYDGMILPRISLGPAVEVQVR